MRVFWAFIFFVSFAPVASAATLEFNHWKGDFKPVFYGKGHKPHNYLFYLDFDLSGLSVSLDTHSGAASVEGSFTGDIVSRWGHNWGEATANLDLDFYDLETDPAFGPRRGEVVAIGLEGESTSAGTLDLALDFRFFHDQDLDIDVFGGFLPPRRHSFFHPFSINFLIVEKNGKHTLDFWVKSDGHFHIGHHPYKLYGDVIGHSKKPPTAIPEPGSLVLLGCALLGMQRRLKSI